MLFVENPSLDPYFNIATEEYLLKHLDTEVVMLWRSNPSIIVGKHQNTLAEINLAFVRKHNIPVVRRLSGGGTVFHDPGNINFTFIRQTEKEKMVDFKAHTRPVIDFLQSMGVDASFQGKNDLRVQGLKISGNAEHVYKNKVLHHGTLLFDSNLDNLNEAIKAKEENFESKAVKSNRSVVANISSFLPVATSREEFTFKLKQFLAAYFTSAQHYTLASNDIRSIHRLVEEKYSQWHWNYGYSPVYAFKNSLSLNGRSLEAVISVKNGIFKEVSLKENTTELPREHPLIKALQGVSHHPDAIGQVLAHTNYLGYNHLPDKWDLLGLFF